MTWSVVARDEATGAFGVAVATRFFAVGALCSHAGAGLGALATQALINPTFGPRGMRLLGEGVPAEDVARILLAGDAGRETRQLHIIDRDARSAVHTGNDTVPWAGHHVGTGFSVAGNMLVGPAVVADTAAAYEAAADLPFAERLLAAMDAGEAAGGDKRGKQSAALKIVTTEEYPALDIRVDDHSEPLRELRRLYEESRKVFAVFLKFLPTRRDPAGVFDRAVINAEIARVAAERGG